MIHWLGTYISSWWTHAHYMSPVTLPLPLRLIHLREPGVEHRLLVTRRLLPSHLPSSNPLQRPVQGYSDHWDETWAAGLWYWITHTDMCVIQYWVDVYSDGARTVRKSLLHCPQGDGRTPCGNSQQRNIGERFLGFPNGPPPIPVLDCFLLQWELRTACRRGLPNWRYAKEATRKTVEEK